MTEEENYVVEKIKQLCIEKCMSRYELSKRSGIPQSSLSAMINRNACPTVTTLKKICGGFGITLSQFFNEKDECVILSDEEKELLISWNRLNDKQRLHLRGYVHGLMEK